MKHPKPRYRLWLPVLFFSTQFLCYQLHHPRPLRSKLPISLFSSIICSHMCFCWTSIALKNKIELIRFFVLFNHSEVEDKSFAYVFTSCRMRFWQSKTNGSRLQLFFNLTSVLLLGVGAENVDRSKRLVHVLRGR